MEVYPSDARMPLVIHSLNTLCFSSNYTLERYTFKGLGERDSNSCFFSCFFFFFFLFFSCFFFCLPSKLGSSLTGKNLLPQKHFFPLRVDMIYRIFQEQTEIYLKWTKSL